MFPSSRFSTRNNLQHTSQ